MIDIHEQDDEADDEELLPEDSQNDGFIIPDGELSEDEGLSSVQQDIDTMCTADHEGASPALTHILKKRTDRRQQHSILSYMHFLVQQKSQRQQLP